MDKFSVNPDGITKFKISEDDLNRITKDVLDIKQDEEASNFDMNLVEYNVQEDKDEAVDTEENEEQVVKTNGIINLDVAPYDNDDKIYKKDVVVFKPGVTVLVGCNGSGKTTMLRFIEHDLARTSVPVFKYDNLHDGGHNSRSKALFQNMMELLATQMTSSEGEEITINIGEAARSIGRFVRGNAGKPELWMLFDAIDSGLSVDNVVDIKKGLFDTVLNTTNGIDVYIIVSANEYEMCNGEECFDVRHGEYIKFSNYDEFRKFILHSRDEKDKRYESYNKKKKRKKSRGSERN